ncbi:beta-glucoside-specific PTS transporter subunit IIABC [Fusibacter ferrireducens]|uniref:PTS glucose transporter subunit IIA n=1 Tax=Fusibacter ferrireducens TaxID=2785058 RepID=A0ABR9ZWB5_9FIRM|nr:beta-glucoside-specific PTS transporter subunit IIABC [Fusibacter ferrireducens]MBF4694641.1 PTS glucose transporter subunit IIA [Fusibacter ferrireducens]
MDYKITAKEILKHVGGKDNISHLEHCSTRLRFSLMDMAKANVEMLEKIDGVMAVKMTGQCQVVVGNEVVEVYDEVMNLVGHSFSSTDDSQKTNEKQKLGAFILDFLISIFQPLAPAVAGAGILKSLLLLLALIGVMDSAGQNYKILSLISDAPLYFLPVLIAASTANKLKVNYIVAMSAASTLLLPKTIAALGEGTQLFGIQLQNISYPSQVFPAILAVILYSFAEKFFTKISPKPIRIFFVPMMSLIITVPTTLLFLGPLGFNLGLGLSTVILFLFNKIGWIAIAFLASVLPFMVATGMHKAMIPYAVTAMTELGMDPLYLPASLAHNIAESGACFAVAIRTKDTTKESIAISAGISALFGITEPALYGVTLQNKKVLSSVLAGSFIGGAYIGITGVKSYALVGPGLASMSMFISELAPKNLFNAFMGLVISFAVAFIVSFILSKETESENKPSSEKPFSKEEILFNSPIIGQMISLSKVNDDIFSSKVVGDGIAVLPHRGELYAPLDGKIETVLDTQHAIGLKADNGAEILFHVGIDTVRLKGQYFESKVKVGDSVKKGDLLLNFDLEKIKAAGFDPVTIAVVTNQEAYKLDIKSKDQVNQTDHIMTIATV